VFNLANHMVRNAPMLDAIGAEIYGPAPAPIARVRDNHRVRILVKAPKEVTIQGALAQWRDSVQIPRDIHISIDIDPQTFY